MTTSAHIKSRRALGYIMQHLTDAPWYEVWIWEHWDSLESNLAFVDAIKNWLELTPQEMWLSHLATYTALQPLLSETTEDTILDTREVTRVEVIDENWRQYTNYNCTLVNLSFQDNSRTLKVFINSNQNDNKNSQG